MKNLFKLEMRNDKKMRNPELTHAEIAKEAPINIGKNLKELASGIKFDAQTKDADKTFAAAFLKDGLKNPKKKAELLEAGFDAIPSATFDKNVLNKNGEVENLGGMTARYAINFGKDPDYEIASGKDENGNLTIYIKEI